ncbi:hypothetical protein PR048_015982 [Dryococelus australis]|uniref:DDE Tnp4 domain-containing protein n=1 Tax=Dryococelus australis TaxID=614101 RepID=A0ABQ9HIU6_9NEOP|nr:hypothetical protein PR048_015982 [Dryococelus australis]
MPNAVGCLAQQPVFYFPTGLLGKMWGIESLQFRVIKLHRARLRSSLHIRAEATSSLTAATLSHLKFFFSCYQSVVANNIGTSCSTLTKMVHNVIDRIIETSMDWTHFPGTHIDSNEAKLFWKNRFRMLTIISALDCHRNVQMTCDAAEKITSIFAEWVDNVKDTRHWKKSPLCHMISHYDGTACLLADSGYGISPYLITPSRR